MPVISEFTDRFTDDLTDKELRRLLFYGDILVVGVFVIAVAFLIRDAYLAGWYYGAGEAAVYGDHLWGMVRDGVVLAGALGWILVRFFRDQLRELRNPWS